MPAKQTTNTINCGSCGIANSPEMSFCLACGKVLSARMAAQRKARGVKKRECTSCKKADELNNRYCIFCGAEIQKRHMGQGNQEALDKFTQEISGVKDRRLPTKERAENKIVVAGGASAAVQQQGGNPAVAVMLYVVMALLSAAAVVYLPQGDYTKKFYAFVAPIKDGLVVYTKQQYVEVVLESPDKKRYLMGSTGQTGTLALADIDKGHYLARFSKPGYETVSQDILVVPGINVVGFGGGLDLPKGYMESSDK